MSQARSKRILPSPDVHWHSFTCPHQSAVEEWIFQQAIACSYVVSKCFCMIHMKFLSFISQVVGNVSSLMNSSLISATLSSILLVDGCLNCLASVTDLHFWTLKTYQMFQCSLLFLLWKQIFTSCRYIQQFCLVWSRTFLRNLAFTDRTQAAESTTHNCTSQSVISEWHKLHLLREW
jgi:hypothetical protein